MRQPVLLRVCLISGPKDCSEAIKLRDAESQIRLLVTIKNCKERFALLLTLLQMRNYIIGEAVEQNLIDSNREKHL